MGSSLEEGLWRTTGETSQLLCLWGTSPLITSRTGRASAGTFGTRFFRTNKGVRQIKGRLERAGKRLAIGATAHPAELGDHPALGMIAGARVAVGELESSLSTDEEGTDGRGD